MKANQSFRSRGDEAVSPVIAVILMVAITVVLAATVYVWVSGFGSQSGSAAKSISLTSAGALSGGIKTYTIASATSGMKYSDFTVAVNGLARTIDAGAATCPSTPSATTKYLVCASAGQHTTTAFVVIAGETISLSGLSAGDTLRLLDTNANSVLATLTVG